jgi:hypothetical protein
MPIRPFLAGRVFEPETIAEMSEAVLRVCRGMGLSDIDDMATRSVAAKIVELVERGVKGTDELCEAAIRELSGRE